MRQSFHETFGLVWGGPYLVSDCLDKWKYCMKQVLWQYMSAANTLSSLFRYVHLTNASSLSLLLFNNVIFELCYVTDTFPASLPTIKWLDCFAQYANNTSSSGEAGADLKIRSYFIFLFMTMFIFNHLKYGKTRNKQVWKNSRVMYCLQSVRQPWFIVNKHLINISRLGWLWQWGYISKAIITCFIT